MSCDLRIRGNTLGRHIDRVRRKKSPKLLLRVLRRGEIEPCGRHTLRFVIAPIWRRSDYQVSVAALQGGGNLVLAFIGDPRVIADAEAAGSHEPVRGCGLRRSCTTGDDPTALEIGRALVLALRL